MTRDRFWEIIEASQAHSQEEQLERFQWELQQLSREELLDFTTHFAQLHFDGYTWDLWVVAWLSAGGLCSDDGFEYFRWWLMSRGRALYEGGLTDPDSLVDVLATNRHPGFERFGYVPGQVYSERGFAEPPELDVVRPKEPTGGEWLRPELKDRTGSKMLNRCVVFREMGDQEFSEIERCFPRVWQFCIEQGIITFRDPNAPPPEPTPEEIARSKVDPNLEKTNFAAYITALAKATREEYERRRHS